ncbi:unnamed protein product [Linum trigynum]|uniref:Myb/SANT-like domain-containing protein n=1 Tax=Linum trigynum TaxID=586398 RepID=A0AAV2EU24_9ROSI
MGRKKKVQGAPCEAVKSEYNSWDTTHDGPFLECLLELTERGLINNGTCKNGVFKELQRMMDTKVPGCGLKAKPTIQNSYKKLKHWYHSTVLMKNQSGFGWDAEKECVSAEKAVWDVFLEQNPTCKTYKGASFPQFFDLAPVFANGRSTGFAGFSGNDPEIISEGDDSGTEDDEGPPVPLAEIVNPAVEEEMFNIINEGVEDKNVNKKKRPANTPMGAPLEKKKKKVQGALSDDTDAELGSEMKSLRPLIQQSVDTIAKAMGESEEHDNMRKELRGNLDKLEGLTRVQRVLAVRILNANPTDLKSFYEMDDEDRLTLILSLI